MGPYETAPNVQFAQGAILASAVASISIESNKLVTHDFASRLHWFNLYIPKMYLDVSYRVQL